MLSLLKGLQGSARSIRKVRTPLKLRHWHVHVILPDYQGKQLIHSLISISCINVYTVESNYKLLSRVFFHDATPLV